MAQDILFKRNGTTPVYANEEAAWLALNNTDHKAAQPVVAFYEKANTIGNIGDSTIAAVFGIGTANGKGKFQGFASQEDFLGIYSEYAAFKELWNQMFELVEIEKSDGSKESYIKAKLSMFSIGDIISGGEPDGEPSEESSGSLATLRDVANDGNGNVVLHGTLTPVTNGCVFTFKDGKWGAETESDFVSRISEALTAAGIVTRDYVNTAIQEAISNLGSNKDIIELQERVSGVEDKTSTLIAGDADKSVRAIASEVLAEALIPEGADESLDTLQEIAEWIQSHPEDAAAMNTAIEALKKITKSFYNNGTVAEDSVKTYIDNAVKALKDGDVTTALNAINTLKSRKVNAGAGLTGGGALNGDVTISHAESDVTITNSEVVTAVTKDKYGHIASVTSKKFSDLIKQKASLGTNEYAVNVTGNSTTKGVDLSVTIDTIDGGTY